MIRIHHTTPRRLLTHLRGLQQDGEALLDLSRLLNFREECAWEVRVWRCLGKIADPHAFDAASERDCEDVPPMDARRTQGNIQHRTLNIQRMVADQHR